MPTVNEVLARVDRVRPSAIPVEDRARWVLEAEGQLLADTRGADGDGLPPPSPWPEAGDVPLSLQPPHDGLYDLYLTAMIEFYSGEYGAYNAAAALYEQARKDHLARYRREHVPERRAVKVW